MAGLVLDPDRPLLGRDFWVSQVVHQAPMLVAMTLMATLLRSTLGLLTIIAGLWLVALLRARAARVTVAAREFLLDVLAMALVLVVPHIQASPASPSGMAMSGMNGASLGGGMTAAILILGWALVRLAMIRRPAARGHRTASVVSGSCCAVGLLVMLLI